MSGSRNATLPRPDKLPEQVARFGCASKKREDQTADRRRAVATVSSVRRNVSVPLGIKIPGRPNIADTLWVTMSDHKNKVYYFQDTTSPSILWVKLGELDFKEGSGARKLQLDGNPDIAGDQAANFKAAEPFKDLAPGAH